MAQIIHPDDNFLCPRTKEAMTIEICIQRFVTANSVRSPFRLCVKCQCGSKNRAALANAFEQEDPSGEVVLPETGDEQTSGRGQRFIYRYYST